MPRVQVHGQKSACRITPLREPAHGKMLILLDLILTRRPSTRTVVPLAGIEPALLAELDFSLSASTNSATGARRRGYHGVGAAVNLLASRPRGGLRRRGLSPAGRGVLKGARAARAQARLRNRPGLMLRRLYDWTLALAATPVRAYALGAVSFAESSFFPVPPDAMLVPMVLARPDRACSMPWSAPSPRSPAAFSATPSAPSSTIRSASGSFALRPERGRRGFPGGLRPVRPLDHPFEGADPDPLQARDDHLGLCRLRSLLVHAPLARHPRRALLHPGRLLRRFGATSRTFSTGTSTWRRRASPHVVGGFVVFRYLF